MFRDLFLTYPTKMSVNNHMDSSNLMFQVSFESSLHAHEYKLFKKYCWLKKKQENWATQRSNKSLEYYLFCKFITKLYSTNSKLRQKTFRGSQHVLMWFFMNFQAVFILGCQMLAEKSYAIFCNPTLLLYFNNFTQNINMYTLSIQSLQSLVSICLILKLCLR